MTMANKMPFFFLVFTHCVLLAFAQSSRSITHHRWHHQPYHRRNYSMAVFSVLDYGAIGDGLTDDTKAFRETWNATCKSTTASVTMHIPNGKTFLLKPITFNGKCKSNNIIFLIDGNITAPSDPYAWECLEDRCVEWIAFEHFDGLYIHGSGTINGQGANWWPLSCKHDKIVCHRKPTGFVIGHSNNVHINNLTFKDSPNMHMAFEESTWVYATNLTIIAPGNSPNTDGIHIQRSTNIYVDQTQISTGDDCISIGDGSSHLNISNILCGPGHGISIGSLGRQGKRETVEFVHVRNVSFRGTQNGVRIKTWQGGKGYVRNIIFEHISSIGSTRPIIIDQYYCPHKHCTNKTSAVKISNVMYNDIFGTSNKEIAVDLACSKSTPCTNIFMRNVQLISTRHKTNTSSYCLNVEGLSNNKVSPKVYCLSESEDF